MIDKKEEVNIHYVFGPHDYYNMICEVCTGLNKDSNIYAGRSIYDLKGQKFEKVKGEISKNNNCKIVTLNDSEVGNQDYGINKKTIGLEEWMLDVLDDIIIQPPQIAIDACTLCQLDCVDCYMRKTNYDGVGKVILSADNLQHLLNTTDYIEEIELSNNGEALLAPDFVDILKILFERGIKATLYNGVNLNDAEDELLEALVKYQVKGITVSIDGATQQVYQSYRRKGNIDTVLSNVRKINYFKEKYKTEYPHLIWQYILMEHNESDIIAAKKMASELNMRIVFKLNWGKVKFNNPEFVKRETGLKVLIRDSSYRWGNRCRQLLLQPHINSDGRLLGCCSSHRYDFGVNVFELGLTDALNSSAYRDCIRSVFSRSKSVNTSVPCGKCSIYSDYIIGEK